MQEGRGYVSSSRWSRKRGKREKESCAGCEDEQGGLSVGWPVQATRVCVCVCVVEKGWVIIKKRSNSRSVSLIRPIKRHTHRHCSSMFLTASAFSVHLVRIRSGLVCVCVCVCVGVLVCWFPFALSFLCQLLKLLETFSKFWKSWLGLGLIFVWQVKQNYT